MLYSQLKGKKIYAIDSARYFGRVIGALIDKRTYLPVSLVLSDADGSILPYINIYGFGDTLTVKSSSSLTRDYTASDFLFFDSGIPVHDVDGTLLGISSDIKFKARVSERLIYTESDAFKLKKIVSSSTDILIINPKNKNISLVNFSPARPKSDKAAEKTAAEEKPVPLAENKSATPVKPPLYEDITATAHAQAVYREPQPSERIVTVNDYGFLLGKRLVRDITDITRTFVLKTGTLINETVIESAKRAGKLVDLTINSK